MVKHSQYWLTELNLQTKQGAQDTANEKMWKVNHVMHIGE